MTSIDWIELSRAVLTASLAILGGLTVLVIGQLIEKFYIHPLHAQARLIGEISFALLYHAEQYIHPDPDRPEAYEARNYLRSLAARLIATTYTVRGYPVFRLLGWVPPLAEVNTAVLKLLELAAGSEQEAAKNERRRSEVYTLLRIRPPDPGRGTGLTGSQ